MQPGKPDIFLDYGAYLRHLPYNFLPKRKASMEKHENDAQILYRIIAFTDR